MKQIYPVIYTLSKECMSWRSQEKKHFALKEYEKAEHCKRIADKMEGEEWLKAEQLAQDKIDKEVVKLRGK